MVLKLCIGYKISLLFCLFITARGVIYGVYSGNLWDISSGCIVYQSCARVLKHNIVHEEVKGEGLLSADLVCYNMC